LIKHNRIQDQIRFPKEDHAYPKVFLKDAESHKIALSLAHLFGNLE